MATATPSSSFTRPNDTTAYASGDLVANSTTAGSVVPLSWTVAGNIHGTLGIRRVRVNKSTTSLTSASFRVHFYTASPTAANGDNAAWSTTTSGYMGSIDVTVDKAFSDGAAGQGAPSSGVEINVPGGTDLVIYGLLEARAGYTPGAQEVFTIIPEIQIFM